MSNPFAYVELHSQSPAQANDFYRHLFDWTVTTNETPGGAYTQIDPGDGLPGGLLATKGTAPSAWVVYVRVADVASATKRAAELGARVLSEKTLVPGRGHFALCIDPAGATFGLWEPLPGNK
jgi:predicted enzyme related to lactoylglutathione lyase